MNPGGGPGGMKPGQNNHNDPMGTSSSDANICRDYMRNGQFGYGFFPLVGQHLNKDIDRAIMLLALHSG